MPLLVWGGTQHVGLSYTASTDRRPYPHGMNGDLLQSLTMIVFPELRGRWRNDSHFFQTNISPCQVHIYRDTYSHEDDEISPNTQNSVVLYNVVNKRGDSLLHKEHRH